MYFLMYRRECVQSSGRNSITYHFQDTLSIPDSSHNGSYYLFISNYSQHAYHYSRYFHYYPEYPVDMTCSDLVGLGDIIN